MSGADHLSEISTATAPNIIDAKQRKAIPRMEMIKRKKERKVNRELMLSL